MQNMTRRHNTRPRFLQSSVLCDTEYQWRLWKRCLNQFEKYWLQHNNRYIAAFSLFCYNLHNATVYHFISPSRYLYKATTNNWRNILLYFIFLFENMQCETKITQNNQSHNFLFLKSLFSDICPAAILRNGCNLHVASPPYRKKMIKTHIGTVSITLVIV